MTREDALLLATQIMAEELLVYLPNDDDRREILDKIVNDPNSLEMKDFFAKFF